MAARTLLAGARRRSSTEQIHAAAKHFSSGPPFQIAASGGADYWEIRLDTESLPYLDDHRIEGVAALPAAVYVEMALAAAHEVFGAQSVALKISNFAGRFSCPMAGAARFR